MVDVDPERIEATVAEVDASGSGALGLRLDVSSEEDMEEMARATLARFGRVDVLVACAGILRPRGTVPTPVASLAVADWDKIIDINLKGTFLSNRAVLGHMIARRSGQIVNISSVFGRQGRAFDNAYCASKAGIIGLSEAISEEVKSYGVRVHVVLPDSVNTPLWDQNPIPRATEALPPARVADFIVYLLAMPEDSMLLNPVIAPFKTRRRGGAPRGASTDRPPT